MKKSPDRLTDAQLLARMADGDRQAFECLYRRHAPRVLGFARGMLKDHARAEDVVQDLFLKLYLSRRNIKLSGDSLDAYLYRAARNAVLNILRSKWTGILDLDACRDMAMEEKGTTDAAERLAAAISSLSPRRNEIVRMKYVEDLSSKDIALRLNLSVRTVEKHLQLAREDLNERCRKLS